MMEMEIRIATPQQTGRNWYVYVFYLRAPPCYHTSSYKGATLGEAVQLMRSRTALTRKTRRQIWGMREP